jgi:A/G-specific adenine glycosylase
LDFLRKGAMKEAGETDLSGGTSRESREQDDCEGAIDADAGWVSRVQDRLAVWFATARRSLPWRVDRDPYRILVSEMMLVQTTVAAAGPYFERFIQRFPDVWSLAEADEAEVLKAWEGLGYYRRARQLHAAARIIVAEHGGEVPQDVGRVRALPGVGRYIAGAVVSQAFDHPEPILEANSRRVLARLIAWRGPSDSSKALARLWECAGRLVPQRGAGDFNQSLMELGALICTPRSPSCLICPVSAECQARHEGLQDLIPESTPKAAPLLVSEVAIVPRKGMRVLAVRRGAGGLWEGFWEFPTLHLSGVNPAGRPSLDETSLALAEGLRTLTGLTALVGPEVKSFKYTVTRHRVTLRVREAGNVQGGPIPGNALDDVRWMDVKEVAELPFTGPARRIASWFFDQSPGGAGET